MSFLKSCLIAVSLATLQACNGEDKHPMQEETSTAAATADVSEQAAATSLPSFAMLDASGHTQNIQSFKGKKLFVNLWATWCPPCRAEMPSIEKLWEAADKEKAQFVLLSLDDDFETAKKYVQAKNLNLPIYFPAGNMPDLFAVDGIPTTFIFNESGELIDQRIGTENYNIPAYRKLFGAANETSKN